MVWDACICARLDTARKKNIMRFICGRLTDCEFIFYLLQIRYNLATECQSVCISECAGASSTLSMFVTRADRSRVLRSRSDAVQRIVFTVCLLHFIVPIIFLS